jgi:2-methylisocitrate lyase-like PEP mutase family enzyme
MTCEPPSTQASKAERLRSLHYGSRAVIFANVWDVPSARVVEDLGYPALATTSAGIANSLGYPDGEHITSDEMLLVVARIVHAVAVPVTADMEAGYASSSKEMYDTACALIRSGAVGLNLEDSKKGETELLDVQLHVEKMQALREASSKLGVPLVINSRTDAYWWKGAKPETRMPETVRRANAYRQAGADCIFVPGLRDLEEIKTFLRESPGPLNVLGGPGVPPIAQLEAVGVRRVSIGSGGYRTAIGVMRKVAEQLQEQGTFDLIDQHAIPFAISQLLLKK